MPDRLPEILLSRLSEVVEEHMGLSFPRRRWPELARAVQKASLERGVQDATSFLGRLLNEPLTAGRLTSLATHLTVAETYFFRDEKLFRVVEGTLLPNIIADRRSKGRNLRIWSAGCSTGEEPYSLAIAISRLLPDIGKWRVEIIATDVNPVVIEHASAGLYTEWSFRGGIAEVKDRYFKEVGEGQYEIVPEIKSLVKFSCNNLIKDSWPFSSAANLPIDLIFCRNVLMYFSPKKNRQVIDQFCGCLHEGGWLVVAPAELETSANPKLEIVRFPGVSLYKKNGKLPLVVESPQDFLPEPLSEPGVNSRRLSRGRTGFGLDQKPSVEPASPVDSACLPANRNVAITASLQVDRPALNEKTSSVDSLASLEPESISDDHLGQVEAVSEFSLRAREFADQGELSEALAWCEKALVSDRLEPSSYYLHGNILQEQGRLDEAMVSFKKALYLDQEMIVALFALGNLYRQLAKPAEADRHFEAALDLLEKHEESDVVLTSEGITAGRLSSIIATLIR